ncbi:PKD domain-containing protein [Endozoicomonas arenosclerae]|uniref:PKD domain-containing protein n=1 Tax=Endozoicomonas arenosclerae TaxID=1633495 RepID=UPI000782F72D|nr:PKD domain-containing protein [Endozoicomonas arenosclerae]
MTINQFVRKLAISSLFITAQTAAAFSSPEPVAIAETIPFEHSIRGLQFEAHPLTINSEHASFIKVHFKRFNVPQGMAVEVSSPDRSQVYQYGPALNTPKTWNPELGENGIDRFSSLSIIGSTAIVRLIGSSKEPNAIPVVEIDSYQKGLPEEDIQHLMQFPENGTESICGNDQKRSVACFSDSFPTEVAHSAPVARLLIAGRSLCTGWRVGEGNLLFTNNHCVESASEARNTEVWFNYQLETCGGSSANRTVVTVDELIKTNARLDYSVLSLNNPDTIASFGYLGLDVRTPIAGEAIYIPQHPGGRRKELGVLSDQNSTNLCRINRPTAGFNTNYLCDTEGGSSGSPVLAESTHKVIGLHHLGGCPNSGVQIKQIWPEVSSLFGGVIPDDGIGDRDNQKPVAAFSVECDGLNCRFDGTDSSDTDGTIDLYSWQLGDGSRLVGKQIDYSYIAQGQYTVSLTVTDNEDKSDTASKTVNVGNTSDDSLLISGVPRTGLSGARRSETRFQINVPEANQRLRVTLSGGSGDADLYVQHETPPTTGQYDCRPYKSSNNETCVISSAQQGTWHVMLRGFYAYAGATLTATVEAIQDNNQNCSDLEIWSGQKRYVTGNKVHHKGSAYQAFRWNTNLSPDQHSDRDGVWKLLGSCQ